MCCSNLGMTSWCPSQAALSSDHSALAVKKSATKPASGSRLISGARETASALGPL
jgi:hypothetical protein